MSFEFPLLSLIIWLPIIFGIAVFATGNDRNAQLARSIALTGSILGILVAIPLYTSFDSSLATMQFVENHVWFERFNVNYHLGVDGISMPLILLNCFITPLVIVAGWQVIKTRVSQYMGAFLVMSGIVNGVFSSLDAILFYVFWEASLIPMFLIIGIWGGPNRVYAAIKFFLYTLLGSLLMLIAFIYLYQTSGGSFSIQDYHQLAIPMTPQILIFVAFLLAFAVTLTIPPPVCVSTLIRSNDSLAFFRFSCIFSCISCILPNISFIFRLLNIIFKLIFQLQKYYKKMN